VTIPILTSLGAHTQFKDFTTNKKEVHLG